MYRFPLTVILTDAFDVEIVDYHGGKR